MLIYLKVKEILIKCIIIWRYNSIIGYLFNDHGIYNICFDAPMTNCIISFLLIFLRGKSVVFCCISDYGFNCS